MGEASGREAPHVGWCKRPDAASEVRAAYAQGTRTPACVCHMTIGCSPMQKRHDQGDNSSGVDDNKTHVFSYRVGMLSVHGISVASTRIR